MGRAMPVFEVHTEGTLRMEVGCFKAVFHFDLIKKLAGFVSRGPVNV